MVKGQPKKEKHKMGMAASQARLLCITARIHDVEQQAQSIQNAKIQLATQSDQVYQEYLEALDATSLTITDWQGNTMLANFNSIVGKNAVDCGNVQYGIRTDRGELVVPEDIYDLYSEYMDLGKNPDPYEFALFAMDPNMTSDNPAIAEKDVLKRLQTGEEATNSKVVNLTKLQESMQKILDEQECESYEDLVNLLESTASDTVEYKGIAEAKKQYDEINATFRHQLYSNYALDVFKQNAGYNPEDEAPEFIEADFSYYINMFKQIQACGGECVSIDDYNGTDGNASTNSEWLKNMINAGKFTIEMIQTDKNTGAVSFDTTGISSDTHIGEEATSKIDKTALAKAEAKYEHDTKEIDAKEKKFDNDLSKLETERTALTTEYDSVKKVINDNIERTFGIFS